MRIPYRAESDRLNDCSIAFGNPLMHFKQWFEEALKCPDVYEANAMTLSTVSRSGRPRSRIVLLKCLDERGFHFFTNSMSQKGQDILNNPHVSLLFYWEPLKRQVRVDGIAELLGDDETEKYFHSRPKNSQISAYVSQQSKPLASEDALLRAYDEAAEQFKDVSNVPRPKTWVGYAVKPDRMEFWQGQTSRLHDRILFFKPTEEKPISEFSKSAEDGWYFERLAP
ncbi:unnamed protein product [Rodentolepis nana]|uniref:pyridoxal 5'-phosphate synthase n=1 Tax=Rodentolepis nana TaxID=102285 RepID=A0A0R3T6U6_RODNA|nr:unnamed protein product [Rodentolepis nana]